MFFAARHIFLSQGKKTRQALASHCCCLSPAGAGCPFSTVAGARSRFRSSLPPAPSFGTHAAHASLRTSVPQTIASFGRRRYYLHPRSVSSFIFISSKEISIFAKIISICRFIESRYGLKTGANLYRVSAKLINTILMLFLTWSKILRTLK